MNTLKNSVRLIGNTGMNPDVKIFGENKKVARFSIATKNVYKTKEGERREETNWHNIVAWGALATMIEKSVKKGYEVILEGSLTNRAYTDRAGVKRYITEITANDLQISKKREVISVF